MSINDYILQLKQDNSCKKDIILMLGKNGCVNVKHLPTLFEDNDSVQTESLSSALKELEHCGALQESMLTRYGICCLSDLGFTYYKGLTIN